jgi:hypothetical protein
MSRTVLCIPDLQIPFQHPHALTFLKRVRDQYKPDTVVCVGDEWDNCALSRYPKDPDGLSAGDEHKRARRASQPFFEAFPDVLVCESNHRQRLYKRAYEAGIPKDMIKATHDYMGAPKGWQWRFSWTIDGVVYEHGDRASGAATGVKLIDANHASTVYGHHHDCPGIIYARKASKTMFAMNVGCLVDENTYAMSYTRMNKSRPVLSCGIVAGGVPHVIPMLKGLRNR